MSQQTEDKAANLPTWPKWVRPTPKSPSALPASSPSSRKSAGEGVDARPTNWALLPRPSWTFPPTCWRIRPNCPRPDGEHDVGLLFPRAQQHDEDGRHAGLRPCVAAPKKGDNRFRTKTGSSISFSTSSNSPFITACHLHDTVSGAEGLDEHPAEGQFLHPPVHRRLSPSNFDDQSREVFRRRSRATVRT